MIDEISCRRIRDDAYIARDAFTAIMVCADDYRLHPDYLNEKLETAKRCIEFMQHFTGVTE